MAAQRFNPWEDLRVRWQPAERNRDRIKRGRALVNAVLAGQLDPVTLTPRTLGEDSPAAADDRGHSWREPDAVIRWSHCALCGVVRRRDGRNKPCRPPAPIQPRDQQPRPVEQTACRVCSQPHEAEPGSVCDRCDAIGQRG